MPEEMTRKQKTDWYHLQAQPCNTCKGLVIPSGYRNSPYKPGDYCDCVPHMVVCKKCGKTVPCTGIQSGEPLFRHEPCGTVTEEDVTDPRTLE